MATNFSLEVNMASMPMADRLQVLGMAVVELALTSHIDAKYPDYSSEFRAALLDANLSQHNITRLAEAFEAKGLMYALHQNENENPIDLTMDNICVCIGGNVDFIKSSVFGAPSGKRIPMKDLGIGFRKGMHVYAMQVAGLIYEDVEFDRPKFWEVLKEYMEPLIGPEDFMDECSLSKSFSS